MKHQLNTAYILILWATFLVESISALPAQSAREFYKQALNEQDNKQKIMLLTAALEKEPEWADAYYYRGNAYMFEEKWGLAYKDAYYAIQHKKKFAEAYYLRGWANYHLQQYEAALVDFDTAMILRKKFVSPLYGKALSEIKLKRFEDAINHLNEVVLVLPESAYKYLATRGYAYSLAGNKEKALADLQEALKLKNDYHETYYYLALLQKDSKPKEALQNLTKATIYKPTYWEAFYERAVLAGSSALNRSGDAIDDYTEVIRLLHPQNEQEKSLKANAFFYRAVAQQSLKNAAELPPSILLDLDSCLQLNAVKDSAYLMKGFVYYSLKDYPKAYEQFEQATKIRPRMAAAWEYRVQAAFLMKDYTKVVNEIDKALALQPSNAELLLLKAQANMELRYFSSAIRAYDLYLPLLPQDEQAWFKRGLAHYETKSYDKAISDFSQALQLNQNPQTLLYRGKAYFRQQKYREALKDLDTYTTLYSNDCGEAYPLKTEIKEKLGDDTNLLNDYKAIIKCNKWNALADKVNTHLKAAVLLYDAGQFEDCLKLLYSLGKDARVNPDVYYYRGLAENELGRPDKAKRSLDTLARLKPTIDSEILLTKGQLNLKQGDYAAATQDFEKLLEQNPKHIQARYFLGLTLAKTNKKVEAILQFSTLIDLNPLHEEAYLQRAKLYMETHNYQAAANDYEKCVEFSPSSVETLEAWSNALIAARKWEKLSEIATTLAGLNPDNAQAYALLALNQKKSLNYNDALGNVQKSLSLNPRNPVAEFTRALLQMDYGKFQEAVGSFTTAIQYAKPAPAEFYYQRALAYIALSQSDNALADLDKCLQLQPTHPEAGEKRKYELLKKGQK